MTHISTAQILLFIFLFLSVRSGYPFPRIRPVSLRRPDVPAIRRRFIPPDVRFFHFACIPYTAIVSYRCAFRNSFIAPDNKKVDNKRRYLLYCFQACNTTAGGYISKMDGEKDTRGFLEILRGQGSLKKPRFSEFSRYLDAKARERKIPLFGQFERTPLCNLSCKMCYVHLSEQQFRGHSLLSAEEWKGLMREAFSAGMFEATLTGGECLTYPGFDDLYLYLQSLGCQVTVMTNGVLLDEKRLRFFTENPPALIQITLYGNSEDAYERVTGRRVFQRVVDNIRRVREAELPLELNVTPNRHLGEDVFETIRLARSLSEEVIISSSLFTPADESWRTGESDDLDPEFYIRIFRFDSGLRGTPPPEIPIDELPEPGGPHHTTDECGLLCGGGRSTFVLDWKGEMRICNRMEARSFPLRDGFAQAWQQINQVACSWPRVPECRECPYESVCDHCAANMLKFSSPGQFPSAFCQRIKYWVSKGILPAPQCNTSGE